MRNTVKVLAVALPLVTFCGLPFAQAAFFGYPRALKSQVEHIKFHEPSLAPIAFFQFCSRYPGDCKVRRMAFRAKPVGLTEARWSELANVNREVNRSIRPERNTGGLLNEKWVVSPKSGECHDYAVTKRHELLAQGWPSRSLLLAEVVLASGEHHLVLVVRTHEGDFVLDNLNANVRNWSQTRYHWVRIQSPKDPKFWSTVAALAA